MGTSKVIMGSDDEDFEDDISNEYHASRARSESAAPLKSHDDVDFDTSGEQVHEAMQEAHAGLFEESPSVNITDQSGHIDLNITTTSNSVKRSRTTMEEVSTKTYGTKKKLFSRPSYSMHAFKDSDDDQEPKKKRTKSAGALPSEVSQRNESQSKGSDETISEMPSSHETHAAGSKQLLVDSPVLFRTQTTVAFTNSATRAATQVATQHISPIVLIPQIERRGPSEPSQPRSSALMDDVEDIEGFLRDDIAAGRSAEAQLELPDTAPQSMEAAGDEVQPSNKGLTVAPQSIMLDHRNEEFEPFYPKSSHYMACVETRSPTPTKEETKNSKRKSSQILEPPSDELDAGLPPPELYKPRPSKSRGRRATADISTLQSSVKSQEEPPKKKNLKRRKTTGDAQAPIEGLADDEEISRPTKKARRELSVAQDRADPAQSIDDAGEQNVIDATTGLDRASTVELGDEIEQAADLPIKPAPKKKRGRPKKADKKKEEAVAPELEAESVVTKTPARHSPRQSADQVDDSDDELAGNAWACEAEVAPSKATEQIEVAEAELEEPITEPSTQRSRKKSTQIPDSDVEDELEADHEPEEPVKKPVQTLVKRGRKPKAKKAAVPASDSEHDPDADEEIDHPQLEPEPAKAPAKRGRKPKAKKSAEVIPVDEPEETEETEAAAPEPEAEAPVVEPEPQRSPLKEKPAAANQDLARVATEDKQQQTAPETPQKQVLTKPTVQTNSWASGKAMHRVGLNRRMKIAPLLKVVKRD